MEGDHQYRGLRTPPADRIAALGASLGTPGTLFLRMRLMPRPVASHWLLAMLVTSALIGAVCAKLNTSGNLEVGLATTHVMIDYPDASIIDRQALPQDLATLQKRAELYGRLTTTTPVLAAIDVGEQVCQLTRSAGSATSPPTYQSNSRSPAARRR